MKNTVFVLEEDRLKNMGSTADPIGAIVKTREEADAYADKDPDYRGWSEMRLFDTAEEAEEWDRIGRKGEREVRCPAWRWPPYKNRT